MSEELRKRIKGIIVEELRSDLNSQDQLERIDESLGVFGKAAAEFLKKYGPKILKKAKKTTKAQQRGRVPTKPPNQLKLPGAVVPGVVGTAIGSAKTGAKYTGAAAGAGALYLAISDAAEAATPYTPAETTVVALSPGPDGFKGKLDKELDAQVKRMYKELGIEPDPGEVFTLNTLMPDSEIGLDMKEVTRITKEIRKAVEVSEFGPMGTDEEAITSALESCRSTYGVSQVSQYYSEIFNESLLERLQDELRKNEFINGVTMPIDSLALIEIDGRLLSEQEFFSQLEREIKQAEKAEAEESPDGGGDGALELDSQGQQSDPAKVPAPPPGFKRKSLSEIRVIISDVPFSSKTYTLDQVYGEGAELEMAEKIYDTFTDDALRNGIATKKLNFTIKFKNGKARKGAVQLRDRRGLQGVFSSQTNIKMHVLRWFKNNNRSSEIEEFDKLDGRIRGSVLIPGGLY